MKFLLDTCTLLWLTEGADELSTRASAVIVDAQHEFVLSVVSIWEIANKMSVGKLPGKGPLDEWADAVVEEYQFEVLPVDLDVAAQVSRLQLIHRDPFDRMLISQAIVHGLVLLTPDKTIRQYPVRTYW